MEKNNLSKIDIYMLFFQNYLMISEVDKKSLENNELICTYVSNVSVGHDKAHTLKK